MAEATAEQRPRHEVDAVTVQVLRNKVASLVDEMHYHFYRSGYSTIIRESRDFSCVIVDCNGRLIVPPPMFFHAPVYRHFVGRILELYPADEIRDGDVFVSNHPYEAGVPHVSDMGFISPIFWDGRLVGFLGSVAHKADIGGTNPGSTSSNSTETYHEGLQLPPIRITEAGTYNTDVERVILSNSRQPDLVRGDIRAQIAATQMGVSRMQQLSQRFGAQAVMAAFETILKGAADELKAALNELPNGVASAEGYMDDDGVDLDTPVKFATTITVKDGDITFGLRGGQARIPNLIATVD